MRILALLSALCYVHTLAFKEPRPVPSRFARTIGQLVNALFPGEDLQSNVGGECMTRFRCYNGTCLSADLTCDGIADCSESEDEISSYCRRERRSVSRNVRSPIATKLSRETWNKIGNHLPMRQAICSDVQFFCASDSKCISVTNLCDQTNECSQGEDEQNCQFVTCPENYLRCTTGKCIPNYWICDQIKDCPSADDETSVDCSTRVCAANQFRCDTGACLPLKWRCDGQVDCLNGDDEANCNMCPAGSIPCQDGLSCITEIQVCDGVTDCGGGTDEEGCNNLPPSTCGSDFACKQGQSFQCIHHQQLCNGVEDCKNGEDEINCPTTKRTPTSNCHGGGRLCRIGSYMHCIPKGKICDGVANCWDGSDEEGCTTPEITTEPTTTPETTTLQTPTKLVTPPCKDGLFCSIGSYVYCIPKEKICDGVVNCWDGTDENGCTTTKMTTEQTTTPETTTLQTPTELVTPPCKDGLFCSIGSYVYCIPKEKICDGVVNCWDGSDENGCTTTKMTTEPTTTPETTTLRTPTELVTPPCKDGLFCSIGSYVYCIPKPKICDGVVNCWDGSDEDGCTTPKITTEPTTTPETTTLQTPTELVTPPCKDGLFCSIGSYVYCIPKEKICDGVVNCWDGSDEDGCTTKKMTTEPTTTPETTTLQTPTELVTPPCKNGLFCSIGSYVYCIPKPKICDGVVNCWDGSDEDGCTTPKITTEPTTTPETTTLQTPTELVTPPCKDGLFCSIGSYVYCIPKPKICDGVVNCWDGSDEDGCTTPKITTEPTTTPETTTLQTPTELFTPPCKDGLFCSIGSYVYCIPKPKICDGVVNCWDGSDEDGCTTPKITTEPTTTPETTTLQTPTELVTPPCKDGLFCSIGSYVYCIPKEKICDGVVNCWDGSDENGCTTPKITTEPTTTPETTTLQTPTDLVTPPCKDGLFCSIGSYVYCIPKEKICDGVVNCWDGSDENGCTTPKITTEPTTTPETTTLQTPTELVTPPCKDGLFCSIGSYVYCIPKPKICDGVVNCWDGSDEDGCTTPKITTEPTTTPETTTLQTPTKLVTPPCKDGLFCSIGSYVYCIPKEKICDGVVNCWDGSDENGCTTPKIITEPTTTPETTTLQTPTELVTPPCKDGLFCSIGSYVYCIPKPKICDGVVNCWDGSDEDGCTTPKITTEPTTTPETTTLQTPTELVTTPCKDGLFCSIGSYVYCIPKEKICDGVVNCWDGSDEDGCTTPKITTEPTTTPETTTLQTPTDLVTTPCKDGLFCSIGSYVYCIPKPKICDGVVNCWDGSDEDGCTTPKITTEPTTTPETTTLQTPTDLVTTPCKDGLFCSIGSYVYCIPKEKICDGVVNCWDGSDEDGCTTTKITTEPTTPETTTLQTTTRILSTEKTPCKNGLLCKIGPYMYCIPESKLCDGVVNCWDGADEKDCATPKPTTVPVTPEIPIHTTTVSATPKIETSAIPPSTPMVPVCMICGDGILEYCIPMSQVCDGVVNCPDGDDEEGCTATTVLTPSTASTNPCGQDLTCLSGSWLFCIPSRKKCDGVINCPDMSDEEHCTTTPPEITTSQRPLPPTSGPSCPGYICASTGLCLPNMLLCDGIGNCPLGDDEANCFGTTTVPQVACVLGQFECNDGTCIPASRSCDSVADCPSGEDEDNCQIQTCAQKFRCETDGVCLLENEWCDGKSDCSDGSDEMDCENCGAGKFACSSGLCINRIQLCDGRPDCPGPDDENGCTVIEPCVGLFDCGNGYCVDVSHRCDGVLHCNNGNDEVGCPVRRGCVGSDFQCFDGTCISNSMRCNGIPGDCLTGEDEEHCDMCKHYMCPNKRCLGPSEMCDGVKDCLPGGEDEDPEECEAYRTRDEQRVISDEAAEKLANQISILLKNGHQENSRANDQNDGGRGSQSSRDQPLVGTDKEDSIIPDPREMRRVQHLKQILQRHFKEV